MEEIIKLLTEGNETISTMESCTGGGIANAITNVPGSSAVFNFGAVTYANEYKIKFGINKNTLDKYSVYSMEIAQEMSKNISLYTKSTYGIGVTGKLLADDINNPYGKNNVVYLSIYDSINNVYYDKKITVFKDSRIMNKNIIIEEVINMLKQVINDRRK